MKPLCTLLYKPYLCLISSGKKRNGTLMNSGSCIGVWRNISFKSILLNLAPFDASEMTLLNSSLVSNMFAAGDPESESYGSLSPPTTMRTRYSSSLRGR